MPSTRRGRIVLAAAGAAGVVVCAAGAVAIRGVTGVPGVALDADWSAFVDAHPIAVVDGISQVLADLGGAPGSIAVAAVLAGLLWWRRGLRTAAAFVLAAVIDQAVVTGLKFLDQRPGPSGALFEDRGSFPSGHTAYAAVIAVVLACSARRPAARVAALALIPVMALSRTVLDAHWLTDTIAGGLCGAGVAAILVAALVSRATPEPPAG